MSLVEVRAHLEMLGHYVVVFSALKRRSPRAAVLWCNSCLSLWTLEDAIFEILSGKKCEFSIIAASEGRFIGGLS